MNADGIFFVDGGTLRPLIATPYENEDLLQRALVDFPEVVAGRVTASEDQRRLLLVKREKGVPIAEGGGDQFSIDHFFVDSEAVPVLVEVKRQSDTRIRREVVGQMLDYAANAVRYWPIDQIQDEFEQSFEGDDPDASLEGFSEVGDGAAFWSAVDHNLRDGKIRMLFVADGFPEELVRVIEFLNEQMSPAEVLGVEVNQYTDGVVSETMNQVEWVETSDVLARLPEGDAWLKRFIKLEFLGSRDVPDEIPLPVAVALAACAQAKARGISRYGRVFELVRSSPDLIDDHLVVAPRSGRPHLDPVVGFEPVPAVVIDLPELAAAVRSGDPIPG